MVAQGIDEQVDLAVQIQHIRLGSQWQGEEPTDTERSVSCCVWTWPAIRGAVRGAPGGIAAIAPTCAAPVCALSGVFADSGVSQHWRTCWPMMPHVPTIGTGQVRVKVCVASRCHHCGTGSRSGTGGREGGLAY